jgi:pimeloyl-ACP methyl ester carboxylesterase
MSETPDQHPYQEIKCYLEKIGWSVACCGIDWEETVLSDWMSQARKVIEAHEKVGMIFGFSVGGLMAMLLSAEYVVDTVVCASPSPYLREELPFIPPMADSDYGGRLVQDLENYSVEILKKLHAKRIEVLLGGAEWQSTLDANYRRGELIGEKLNIFTVPHAPHDVRYPPYLETIEATLYDCTPDLVRCDFDQKIAIFAREHKLRGLRKFLEGNQT